MARFLYQAKAVNNQIQSGQMDAANETEVAVKLRAQKMTPLKIAPLRSTANSASFLDSLFQKKVPSRDLQIFTRQFSTLINSGIPVVDSLRLLSEGKRNPMLKEAATKVKLSIESGKSLGDSMAAHPLVFDRFFINMVRAGEEAGILDGILMRLASYLEKSEKIKKQVIGALVYPAVIIFVASLVITGILVFIIPKMQELYGKSGQELPGLTQMVVAMSAFLVTKWYIAVAVVIGASFLFMYWYRSPEGKDQFDRMLIQAPLFGDLVQKSSIARMTRTLSTLLSSGVGVIEALEIAAKTAGNKVIEDTLIRSKESVTAGRPLAAPLAKEKLIPDMVVQMISIGEQSGAMDTMLGKIADFYEDDVENAVKALTSLIEPLLMVFLGGIIAFLVIAMYLPIFNLASVAGG